MILAAAHMVDEPELAEACKERSWGAGEWVEKKPVDCGGEENAANQSDS